jgi:ferredoxin
VKRRAEGIYADYERLGDDFDPSSYIKFAEEESHEDQVEDDEEEEDDDDEQADQVEVEKAKQLSLQKVRPKTFIYFLFILKHLVMFILCLGIGNCATTCPATYCVGLQP